MYSKNADIQERIELNQWLPNRISNIGPTISHIFFANDCLLFTSAKTSQVMLVHEVSSSLLPSLWYEDQYS